MSTAEVEESSFRPDLEDGARPGPRPEGEGDMSDPSRIPHRASPQASGTWRTREHCPAPIAMALGAIICQQLDLTKSEAFGAPVMTHRRKTSNAIRFEIVSINHPNQLQLELANQGQRQRQKCRSTYPSRIGPQPNPIICLR